MKKEELITLSLPYYDGTERTVRVFIPAHEEGEELPVIYMTDGQNLFDERPEQFGCWHTMEAVRAERSLSGKAAIIVGIHNDTSPLQRTKELTPKDIGALNFPPDMPKKMRRMMIPEGERFDDFVLNTVIPVAEARFPVKKGRAYTAFCGSSSGGLQSFFTVLSHPDRFSYAGVFSPAFMMYHTDDLDRWICSMIKEELPNLWIYSGGEMGLEREIMSCVETVCEVLEQVYPKSFFIKDLRAEQPHHESAWEPVFKDFLHTFLKGE